MTCAYCPRCRLRYPAATALQLSACPFCGRPLEQVSARAAFGSKRMDLPEVPEALIERDVQAFRARDRGQPPVD